MQSTLLSLLKSVHIIVSYRGCIIILFTDHTAYWEGVQVAKCTDTLVIWTDSVCHAISCWLVMVDGVTAPGTGTPSRKSACIVCGCWQIGDSSMPATNTCCIFHYFVCPHFFSSYYSCGGHTFCNDLVLLNNTACQFTNFICISNSLLTFHSWSQIKCSGRCDIINWCRFKCLSQLYNILYFMTTPSL